MQTNLNQILNAAAPTIEKMLQNVVAKYTEEKGKSPNNYELEYFKLEFVIDLIKAVGGYIVEDDIVTVTETNQDKGVVIIYANVTRNNVVYAFNTEVIVAGGYNVQVRHLRYLVKTKLPNLKNTAPVSVLNEKAKALKKTISNAENLQRITERYNKELEAIKAAREITDEQLLKTGKAYPYDYDYKGIDFTTNYENLTPEEKARFSNMEKYYISCQENRERILFKDKAWVLNEHRIKALVKEYEKQVKKYS